MNLGNKQPWTSGDADYHGASALYHDLKIYLNLHSMVYMPQSQTFVCFCALQSYFYSLLHFPPSQIGNSSLKLPYLPHNNLGWPYLSSRWDRNKPGSMHGSRTGIKTVHIVLEYIYSAAVASLQRLISPSPHLHFLLLRRSVGTIGIQLTGSEARMLSVWCSVWSACSAARVG